VPQIVEGPVDFGVTLTRRVRISGIRWFGLVLQPELTDGTGTAIEGDPAYRWKETDGKKQAVVPLGAVVLVVTSSQDRNSVTVEPALVKPPTPPGQKTSEQKTP
jgi:hypothetical protein